MPILGTIASGITGNLKPLAPTIGTATAGDASASVTFTAAGTGPAATSFTAISSPGSFTATGVSSPLTVSGLTNGTAYTFTVYASNANGNSASSSASNSITPFAAGNYDLIQTVVSNGSATYFDFTSIPQTYKYLEIRGFGSNTTGSYANIALRMNSDSGNNYWNKWAVSNANSLSSAAYQATEMSSVQSFPIGTQMGIAVITIFDYTSTSKLKGMTVYGGASQPSSSTGEVSYGNGQWASTSAITSIRVLNTGNPTWTSGTTFSLYGIGA